MKLLSSSKHRLVPLDPNHNWLLKEVFPLMSNPVLDILFLSLTKGNLQQLFKVVVIVFYFFFKQPSSRRFSKLETVIEGQLPLKKKRRKNPEKTPGKQF